MLMNRKRWMLVALVPAIGLGTVALAAGPMGPMHHGPPSFEMSGEELREHLGDRTDHVLDAVDATDEQRTRVDTLLDELAPRMEGYHDEHEELRESFKQAMSGDDVDAKELEGLRRDAVDLIDRASSTILGAALELREVLTPEQRAEALQKGREHHERMERHHGPPQGMRR